MLSNRWAEADALSPGEFCIVTHGVAGLVSYATARASARAFAASRNDKKFDIEVLKGGIVVRRAA